MKYKITLEVKVPDGTSFEDAEDCFMYASGYACQCRSDNPLLGADIETTDFNIEEL